MKVVTADTIRELDRRAIGEFGIPGAVLMENAGRAVVEAMVQEFGALVGKRIAIFCGAGNNGGDGYVIARHLHLLGAKATVYLLAPEESLQGDARIHFEVLKRLGLPIQTLVGPEENITQRVGQVDLIVDALLGTGIRSAPREPIASTIRAIHALGCPVVAVDIPSGVDADTGATPGEAIRATITVTFAYPKLGLFLFPGAECVGRLRVSEIGFDWERLEAQTPYRLSLHPVALRPGSPADKGAIGPAETHARDAAAEFRGVWGDSIRAEIVKKRAPESNKGDYGHVGILAGSRGMAGAPALVARAAQRVGAGLVTVLAAACVQATIAGKLDEQMTVPLPDADGAVSEAAFDTIARFAEKATVLCIGPGLTTEPGAAALVRRLLTEIPKPMVLDADGLNALAQQPEIIDRRPDNPRAPLILTPHPGEAARLLGTSIAAVQSNRIASVQELARRYHAVALLKGRYTLIADPNGGVAINTSGNPGMATGGMGDTLTGILGGLLAQVVAPARDIHDPDAYRAATFPPQEVVALGAYLHGLAGDLAVAQQGETGLVTGDLIERLPAAIRLLEE